MNIVLTSGIVPQDTLNILPKGDKSVFYGDNAIGYSTMFPIASPMFPKASDVVDWFNSLPSDKRMQFVSVGMVAIYYHVISLTDQLLDIYHAKAGEILTTDEFKVYERINNKWI